MKPAIVCLLWDKELGVLVHFLARFPCTVLVLAGNRTLQKVAPILADAGGEVQVLESFLSAEDVADIERRVELGIQYFAEDLASDKWADFCARERVTPEIAEHLVTDMAARLRREMILVEALHQARQIYDIKLVAVNEDYTQLSRTAVEWAQVNGVASLHVAHGTPLCRPYTVHQFRQQSSSVLAAYGEHDKKMYLDAGFPESRLRITGNPAWDVYAGIGHQLASERAIQRANLCAVHQLNTEQPIVVFGSTWAAFLSASDDLELRYIDSLTAFLQAAKQCQQAGKRVQWVVKDRPNSAALGRANVDALCKRFGLSESEVWYAMDDAFDWVVGADMVVAIDSNLLVEAMLVGTPCINLMSEIGLRMGPSFDYDSGVLEVPPESLAETVLQVLEDLPYRHEIKQRLVRRAPYYNAGHDGRATRRVAALMLEMVGVDGAEECVSGGQKKRYVWESLGGGAGERDAHEVYMSPPRREVVGMFLRHPKRVLEVGCSTGSTGQYIKQQYPGAWVAGVELSAAAAKVAEQHMDVVIQQKFEDCEPESYGITRGSIDTVILADVLEHMYDPWGVLVRIRPYLTPDAQVIASIPNSRNLWLMNELANGRFPYAPVGLLDITHIRFFTRTEIEKLFVETGYAVEAWGRTPDPRLYRLALPPDSTRVETEKLVLKDVTPEEFEDLKCLQFLVCATPAEAAETGGGNPNAEEHAQAGVGERKADTGTRVSSAHELKHPPELPPNHQSNQENLETLLASPCKTAVALQRGVSYVKQGVLTVAVYSLDVQTSACPQIRYFRPFRGVNDVRLLWAVEPTGEGSGWRADLTLEADVYVISRLFPGAESEAMMEAIFAKGKPVVYETDDLLIDLPEDNMHAADYAVRKPYIEAVMRRADALIVSTPELAMRVRPYNSQVHVMPNLVDYGLLYQAPPDNKRQVNIGILGTSTRGGDFALIDETLRQLCKEYGKRIRLFFVGGTPEAWAKHPNVEAVPFLPEYGAYVARMKGLRLDIGLAPLADSPFNASKSAIKWLEFSALGAAGVFSAGPAYQNVVDQGVTGLLVSNQPDKWLSAIKLLVDYPEKRLEIALAAQRKVLQDFSLQRHFKRIFSIYRRVIEAASAAVQADQITSEATSETSYDAAAGAALPEAEQPQDTVPDHLYRLWQAGHTPQVWDMTWVAECIQTWAKQGVQPATFHLGVICRAGSEAELAHNIQSLYAQYYKAWRLTVVAEAAMPEDLAELVQVQWLTVSSAAPSGEAIALLSAALAQSDADWVGMVEAGDQLPPQATFQIAHTLQQHPHWQMLYTDEDRINAEGERHTPFFKTDFNPDMLRAAPFTLGGLLLVSRSLFAQLDGFRPAFEGVESWDLALRVMETLAPGQVGHVADVLYHRFDEGGHVQRAAEDVMQTAEASLNEHFARLGRVVDIQPGLLPGCFQARPVVEAQPLVSILLPAGNDVEQLKLSLTHLIEGTCYSHCEVLILSSGSLSDDLQAFLQAVRDMQSSSLRVLNLPECQSDEMGPVFNAAAAAALGEYIVLFNPGLQVVQEDWLDVLLGVAQEPGVAAAGARFVNANGEVTHAGWLLGLNGMSIGPMATGNALDDPGYFGRLLLPQALSALDTACLLLKKADFLAVAGFTSEIRLPELASVDLCRKLQRVGEALVASPAGQSPLPTQRLVWTPHATLLDVRNTQPAALSAEKSVREAAYRTDAAQVEAVVDAWPQAFSHDPAYNRNLSLMLPFTVEPTPALTLAPDWHPAPRILATHADTMGCGEYRIIAPMRTLMRTGKVMGWDAGGYFHPREYARMAPQSIVMQRQLMWGQIELIERIARISPAFRVFELDDLITNIPIMSSQKKIFVEQKDIHKRFRKALSLFHRFVVSTDYLAETYQGYCDEVVVVPNYLERARWDGHTPQRLGGKKARVGWAGSATHAGDLRLIVDVVKATATEVDWIFFGMCPDAIRHLVKEYHEPVKLQDYASQLASLNLDLAIAPLEDIPFNHGKSHLRLLEYGVMGYPVICTDITPYRGNFPVTRVSNKFKSWVEAIRGHVADRSALARQGDALQAKIQQHWMLDDHLDVWLKAWLPE